MGDKGVTTFQQGECKCPACGAPLAAHEVWPGAKFRYCGRAKCTEALREHDHGRYVAPNTVRCEAEGCGNYLPEGFYRGGISRACCSAACWQGWVARQQRELQARLYAERKGAHKDGLTPTEVRTNRRGLHNRRSFLELVSPVFRPVVEQYFTDFVPNHYREQGSVRSAIGRLCRFLTESQSRSLEEVDSATITQFLAWAAKDGRGVKTDLLPCVSTFFKWLGVVGLRKSGNPVNTFLHGKKKKVGVPRPLQDDELATAWELMEARGDARLRLVLAIAEESGMRIGEISNIRVSDVEAKKHRIFVRTPNKRNQERFGFFGPKTAKYLADWMAERDAACGHDHLLYNHSRNMSPYNSGTLGQAMSHVLCMTYGGEVLHDTGFDEWRTHRMRHTMGTKLAAGGADAAVVMAVGGWTDPKTMSGYVKINDEQAKHGYAEAMRRAEQQRLDAPQTKVMTPQEYLACLHDGKLPAKKEPEKHCV